jgi:hypothetical protein
MPWHVRIAASRTRARAAGKNDRTVASKVAVSGMMLAAVPAWNVPTMSTTGSKMSSARVTMTGKAPTIAHAAAMGSVAAMRPGTVAASAAHDDGRLPYTALAGQLSMSVNTVRRKLDRLLADDQIVLRCNLAQALSEWPVTLWGTVPLDIWTDFSA